MSEEFDDVSTAERVTALLDKVHEHYLATLFSELNDLQLRAILIKGWAATRNYPEDSRRSPGDIDLLIDPSEAGSEEILSLTGNPRKFGAIDLHAGPRHLDTLSFEELFERSGTVDLDGVPIRTLCPEDHLRVLCVHWLTDGGEKKDRLWDIYWAVENRPSSFSWEKCLGVVSARRRRWVVCTIGLAHKHLDLAIDDLPFAEEAKELPVWFTRAVESRWNKGVPHVPLSQSLDNFRQLSQQMRKRLPPSPVMATIGMEGSFDARTRVHYQIGYLIKQAVPSLKRIHAVLRGRR
ncbi:MAG: nucleotidyltransferase family protein [Aridibacter famidurans]|nr:nucleotidyltransferase family protein [Aridibacter famidurans]